MPKLVYVLVSASYYNRFIEFACPFCYIGDLFLLFGLFVLGLFLFLYVGITGHVGHASVRGLEKARYTKSILKDLNLA